MKIKRNDPQSANIEINRYLKYYYENDPSINIDIKTKSTMFTKQSPSTYEIIHQIDINNQHQPFFNKNFNLSFPSIYN